MLRLLALLLLGGSGFAAEGVAPPPAWSVLPFVVLLGMIAVMPLVRPAWWHHRYPLVSYALGAVVALFYLIQGRWLSLVHVGFEYLSFVAVLACLYLVAAGIIVRLGFRGSARTNTFLLLFGALLANLIGTTGASVLLIRPYMLMNRGRLRPYHLVFFIFLVSNIGGALTPIGDPPLMLGYLKGIEFFRFYELNFREWLTALALLGGIFYLIDRRNPAPPDEIEHGGELTITGVRNIGLLAVAVACIMLDPNRVEWVPGIVHAADGWSLALGPAPAGGETFSFMRELLLLAIGFWALRTTPAENLRANGYTSEPIREVAVLFVGIFLTMMPALELIRHQAAGGALFGLPLTPLTFYFGTGVFSGVLDNAPTFMAFLAGMEGKYDMTIAQLGASSDVTVAHSLGACAVASVFWGALTYIGNGPNFMVKAIAESATDDAGRRLIEVPSFFGYIMRYSLPILLPVLLLIGWLYYS